MSYQLVSRSPDLQQLRDEGYDFEIRASQLVVNHVPFVTTSGTVDFGMLVSELSLQGDTTTPPGSHVIHLVGSSVPCDQAGAQLPMINQVGPIPLGDDLTAACSFSAKPAAGGYSNYHQKISSYVAMLEGPAQAIDPKVTARTFPPVPADEGDSVFRYLDSASSRSRIEAVSEKLALAKVVIVGLGGTGSYILDLVAKTRVREIHLFDGDVLLTHNAFRAPGATTLEELRVAPLKVDYFQAKYDAMHRNITAHGVHIDESNVEELRDASFVFLSMEGGPTKRLIIERLEQLQIPFIDVGMGLQQLETSLIGVVRTTTSTEGYRSHVWNGRVNFADDPDAEYDQNIQIADLNMLNAALAIIKWKKLFGFYMDFEHEFSSTYTIDGNHLLNEDQSDEAP